MHNFKELQVWEISKSFCVDIYNLTKSFPSSEQFGLISPLNRAAVSVPSNIAEGSSRKSNKDFSRFLDISLGSSFEIETQLIIALELKFLTNKEFDELELKLIQKMLYKFNNYLKNN